MYLQVEPDAMTSMALVHSRIRRVYILQKDPKAGGIGGRWNVHTMRGLNHHFRVFSISHSDSCEYDERKVVLPLKTSKR